MPSEETFVDQDVKASASETCVLWIYASERFFDLGQDIVPACVRQFADRYEVAHAENVVHAVDFDERRSQRMLARLSRFDRRAFGTFEQDGIRSDPNRIGIRRLLNMNLNRDSPHLFRKFVRRKADELALL